VKNDAEIAMVQPAVLILNCNNEIVYFWKADVSAGAFYGATYADFFFLDSASFSVIGFIFGCGFSFDFGFGFGFGFGIAFFFFFLFRFGFGLGYNFVFGSFFFPVPDLF
jgi:hypothetical protein